MTPEQKRAHIDRADGLDNLAARLRAGHADPEFLAAIAFELEQQARDLRLAAIEPPLPNLKPGDVV